MQTDDIKLSIIQQTKEFLTYTADTDNDTIMAQYTLIEGLIDKVVTSNNFEFDSSKVSSKEENKADYEYFLNVNTVNSQSIERKGFALEGLQERLRNVLRQVSA